VADDPVFGAECLHPACCCAIIVYGGLIAVWLDAGCAGDYRYASFLV
jgi:hypothetical protein